MVNLSPALYLSFHLAPTSTMSPQSSWPMAMGFSAMSAGTRLWSLPCMTAL